MVDIQSPTAAIRREKNQEEEEERKKERTKMLMSTHGGHKERRRDKTPTHAINVQSLITSVGESQAVDVTPV